MDKFNTVGTVISNIISSVALVISLIVSFHFFKKEENEHFGLQLQNILKFKIEHPYFDDTNFINSWNPELKNDEKYLRYSVFCNIVFNYLYDLYRWKKTDKNKLENYISVRRWVKAYEKYWRNKVVEFEKQGVYEKKFLDLINSYL